MTDKNPHDSKSEPIHHQVWEQIRGRELYVAAQLADIARANANVEAARAEQARYQAAYDKLTAPAATDVSS